MGLLHLLPQIIIFCDLSQYNHTFLKTLYAFQSKLFKELKNGTEI